MQMEKCTEERETYTSTPLFSACLKSISRFYQVISRAPKVFNFS